MSEIYLVEEIWVDSYENQPSNAVGYSPIGYTTKPESISKELSTQECWALKPNTKPRYKITRLKCLDGE